MTTTKTRIPPGATWLFISDDCRRGRTCVCGMCKWSVATAAAFTQSCDFGACRRTACGYCPRFGYPVCERHAHANCHSHAQNAACHTRRAA